MNICFWCATDDDRLRLFHHHRRSCHDETVLRWLLFVGVHKGQSHGTAKCIITDADDCVGVKWNNFISYKWFIVYERAIGAMQIYDCEIVTGLTQFEMPG